MATPKRLDWSAADKAFNKVLAGSLLLHLGMFLLVMNVEPPPPPTQEEYATWLKKVTPPKVVEEEPPPPPEPVKKEKKPEELPPPEEEVARAPSRDRAAPTKAAPAAKPAESARRAQVRKQLSGAGILGVIGAVSEEGGGGLTNVFESGQVVSKDLNEALSERGGIRVTGGTRIGKKGALGAGTSADIGEVDAGAGGSAGELGGRQGVTPKAFVSGGEAVIKTGGIDEKGVRLALQRRAGAIQQCYERALRSNAKLSGKVVLQWLINELGKVELIKIVQNTLADKAVSTCIADTIKSIYFPRPTKGSVPVTKTFEFTPGST
jgi:outer membrane biosynthesis protein TonB